MRPPPGGGTCHAGRSFIGARIRQAKLPVLIGLVAHRIQQLLQKLQRRIVHRHDHADLWRPGLVMHLAHQQVHRRKLICTQGLAREQRSILPPCFHLGTDPRKTQPPQRCQEHKRREGAADLPGLADQITGRPGDLPELRASDLCQGVFQLLLVAAAERKIAAQALKLGILLLQLMLGAGQVLPHRVQLLLIALGQRLRRRQDIGLPVERRRLRAAPVFPAEITIIPPLCQRIGPAGQKRAVCCHQQQGA